MSSKHVRTSDISEVGNTIRIPKIERKEIIYISIYCERSSFLENFMKGVVVIFGYSGLMYGIHLV